MTSLTVNQATTMNHTGDPGLLVQRTFERCGQAFCRYFTARTGNDPHLVDDLMQQLWLQARLNANAVRRTNPEPWLWRIAQNLWREHLRRRGRSLTDRAVPDAELARALARQFDEEDLPHDVLARKEVQDQLLLALTELSSDDQELLIGFYFEDRSQAELAGMLCISERAVEGRLYRARLALRDKLAYLET